MKRAIILVIDSVGVGALPDSERFGDIGVNTFKSAVEALPGIELPNLISLGMGCIEGLSLDAVPCAAGGALRGAYGRAAEVSNGKDTTTGHWEIAGLHNNVPFKTYPNGFPAEVIEEFEKKTGRKIICNRPASGTVIIEELGERHMKTGELIVYTSADSVFQIAAHEDVVPVEELYRYCQIAREMLVGDVSVGRVIARPFVGEPGNFTRTPNRRDFSVDPIGKTLLDYVVAAGMDSIGIGKISDIFNGVGITESHHIDSNSDGMAKLEARLKKDFNGLLFVNLVDFDSKFGHRRNAKGYGEAIEQFDRELPAVMAAMRDEDMLIICADHGNDPNYNGTDHTREYIPVLVYGKPIKPGSIGTRKTFSDIGATVADYLGIEYGGKGESFLPLIQK